MAMNFEPHKCVIFFQEIGTHENKGIHSIYL